MYILLVSLIKISLKLIYFVCTNPNPMNSDSKYVTSCRYPLTKNVRNVINFASILRLTRYFVRRGSLETPQSVEINIHNTSYVSIRREYDEKSVVLMHLSTPDV